MIVQNDSKWITYALIGAVALGALAYDKMSHVETSVPTPTPESQGGNPVKGITTPTRMPGIQAANGQSALLSTSAQPVATQTPTSPLTSNSIQPTLVYQTVIAGNLRATVESVQAQATLDALNAGKSETAVVLTRASEQWNAQQTRTVEDALANSAQRSADAARQNEADNAARDAAKTRETINNFLLIIGVLGIVACLIAVTIAMTRMIGKKAEARVKQAEAEAKESEARIKEAEAKACDAKRRLLEVQAALQTKERERAALKLAASMTSNTDNHNGNGNGHGDKTGVTASQN